MQPMNEYDYWSKLDDEQRAAATYPGGKRAIIGGAGAGKTFTLVGLLVHLVKACGLSGNSVLAMTFTRAGAGEMNRRFLEMGIADTRVGTIHSVCMQILQATRPKLLESIKLDDSGYALQRILKHITWDFRKQGILPKKGVDFEMLNRFVSRCKLSGPVPVFMNPFGLSVTGEGAVLELAKIWRAKVGATPEQLLMVYNELESRRATRGTYSFDDMINWAWSVLVSDGDALSFWRHRWECVISDETQDSGVLQWDLGLLLSGLPTSVSSVARHSAGDSGEHNLIAAGDPAQAIFSFTGGDPQQLVGFCQQKDTDLRVLHRNYRSRPQICAGATELIKGKVWHVAKEMRPVREEAAQPSIEVKAYETHGDEAVDIIRRCREHAASGGKLADFAILARLSSSLYLFELECIRHRVPYVKMAGGSFLEGKEVKDVLAYLRVAACVDTDGKHLRHIINVPFRYIGGALISTAEEVAKETGIALLDVLLKERSLGYAQRHSLLELHSLLIRLNKMAVAGEILKASGAPVPTVPPASITITVSDEEAKEGEAEAETGVEGRVGPADMIAETLQGTDYIEEIRREDGLAVSDESKLSTLNELQGIARHFHSCADFLAYVDWMATAIKIAQRSGLKQKEDATSDAVRLSTIHRAKGLQWLNTFVVDVVPGRFPCSRAEDPEEELRLAYVAVSRAMDYVQVSFPLNEGKKRSPYILTLQRLLENGGEEALNHKYNRGLESHSNRVT